MLNRRDYIKNPVRIIESWSTGGNMNYFDWEIKVSIFKNRFLLKEIGIAVGIPLILFTAFTFYISFSDLFGSDKKYAVGLSGIFIILTSLFLLAVYKGKYAPGFIVDNEGIINYSYINQFKTNPAINILIIFSGLFRGNFTVTDKGAFAHSKHVIKIKWKNAVKVKYYPKQYAVYVQGGFAERIAVFCTKENYDEVAKFICSKTLKSTIKKGETQNEEI